MIESINTEKLEEEGYVQSGMSRSGLTLRFSSETGLGKVLEFEGYWLVKGKNFESKKEFRDKLEEIADILSENLDFEIEFRNINGTKIGKTPVKQGNIVEQIENQSEDIEPSFGIDRSKLEKIVVDTNLLDARVISELVIQGELYDCEIIIPEAVLQEIHVQAEENRSEGLQGMKELGKLRRMRDSGLISLDIPAESNFDASENVNVDHHLISEADRKNATLCTDDQKLLDIANLMNVEAIRLQQDISKPESIIEQILDKEGEIESVKLIKKFREKVKDASPFHRPSFTWDEEEALDSEIEAEQLIRSMERKGKVYRKDNLVGRVERVTVVPELKALKEELVSDILEGKEISRQLDKLDKSVKPRIVLPSFLDVWANVEDNKVRNEIGKLERLDEKEEIELNYEKPNLTHREILEIDESFVEKSMRALIEENRRKQDVVVVSTSIEDPEVSFLHDG